MVEVTDVPSPQHDAEATVLAVEQLDYHLPEHLIATRPAQPRDSARMLVMHRSGGDVEHRCVRDLPEYLGADDTLVFNTTAVAPSRIVGRRAETGGHIEGLVLAMRDSEHWHVMLRSNGRLKTGQRVTLHRSDGKDGASIILEDRLDEGWIARVEGGDAEAALYAVGRTPLPPYILRARGEQSVSDDDDRAWYQTVYADAAHRQSVAAPTAGLHFTPELLERIQGKGVQRLDVLLHVGVGTFKPVTAATLAEHIMHVERYEVPPATLAALAARQEGYAARRLIAVGTTTVRTLESLSAQSASDAARHAAPLRGETDLLIAPPYDFRVVQGMLTNFHLPRSTLLALVAAMVGLDRLKAAYAEAIDRGYRFYSYGDAMLILP